MIREETTPIITKIRRNEDGSPTTVPIVNRGFVAENATLEILESMDEFLGFEIISPTNLNQVFDIRSIGMNSYYVNFNTGIVYFNEKSIGTEIIYSCYGNGFTSLSGARVHLNLSSNGSIQDTIESTINDVNEGVEYLKAIGDAVEITNNLDVAVNNGEDCLDNLQNSINLSVQADNQIKASTVLANTKNNEVKETTRLAEVKNAEVKVTTTNAESKRVEVVNATTAAEVKRLEIISISDTKKQDIITTSDARKQDIITTADTKKQEVETATASANISKTQLQTVIDDSVVKKTALDASNTLATTKKIELDQSIANGDIPTMKTDIEGLKTDKMDSTKGTTLNKFTSLEIGDKLINQNGGYFENTNGIIEQWGVIPTGLIPSNGTFDKIITFPKVFPTKHFPVFLQVSSMDNQWTGNVYTNTTHINNNTQARIVGYEFTAGKYYEIHWQVKGY